MNTKIKRILFGLTGIASVVLSIVCYCMYTGGYDGYKQYGGDAYTGIQNSAAKAANNITYLGDILKFGLGSILLIMGVVLIIVAITIKASNDYSNRLDAIDSKLSSVYGLIDKRCLNTLEQIADAVINDEEPDTHTEVSEPDNERV